MNRARLGCRRMPLIWKQFFADTGMVLLLALAAPVSRPAITTEVSLSKAVETAPTGSEDLSTCTSTGNCGALSRRVRVLTVTTDRRGG